MSGLSEARHIPTIEEYADRIIAMESRIDELRDEQIGLMREIGKIRWEDNWISKDGKHFQNPMDRFVSIIKIDDETNCWNWPAHRLNSAGYGMFFFNGTNVSAHRWAIQMTKGLIGSPLVVDHLCKNKSCVNPIHLEEVTQSTNARRAFVRRPRKTHCKHGHLLDENNSYRWRGYVSCRTCNKARKLAWLRQNGNPK